MTEQLVREWLADYAALSPAEIHSFASTVHHNKEVIAAVYNVLDERHKYHNVSRTVNQWLTVHSSHF